MTVLVACEFSGIVRDAFLRRGHVAMSCDMLSTEKPGPHRTGDVLEILNQGWDLMIAHPPCTYLTNAGARHLHESGPKRWIALFEAARFFRALLNAPIPRIAVENPIPHGYARDLIGGYSQIIQPWQFGHGETKATCLWLKNVPKLVPTNIVNGREHRIHRMLPGPDRWRERSRTFFGVAEAMAEQWGTAA